MFLFSLESASAGVVRSGHDPCFVLNLGEASPDVKYLSRGALVVAEFSDHAMSLGTLKSRMRVEFEGAMFLSEVTLQDHSVVYRNMWPRVDIQYSLYQGTIKSEYHLAPGADPNFISLRYSSESTPRILRDGSLYMNVSGAEFVESPPYAYQERGGRVEVPVEYRIYDDGTVGFAVGYYDHSLPLVIDPVINTALCSADPATRR